VHAKGKAEADPWHAAKVETTDAVGLDRVRLVLEVGRDAAEGHTAAGQFVQVRVASPSQQDLKPAYMALANPPTSDASSSSSQSRFEMVVKRNEGTAGVVCDLKRGDTLDVSDVIGKGFGLKEAHPAGTRPNVLLFATGTGIAPIRALISSGDLDIPNRKDVQLYYGFKNNDYCAYSEEIATWERMGINVVPVMSEPPSSWRGETGYVQDVFARRNEQSPLQDPAGTVAVVAGQPQVTEAVNAIFKEAKVPDGRVLTNF